MDDYYRYLDNRWQEDCHKAGKSCRVKYKVKAGTMFGT